MRYSDSTTHCQNGLFGQPSGPLLTCGHAQKELIKGALYGIEPSTRNRKIWPTRERQHRQYLKISCCLWRCCAAERWTKLRQLTRQACRVITVVAIFNSWLLKVILDSAVVETYVIYWKREARVRVWFKFNKIFLGTNGAASSRVGQILPLRVEGSTNAKVQSHTVPL